MASEGKEFDVEEETGTGIDSKEKIAKQRQLLNAKLGFDVAAKIGFDTAALFSNDDLMMENSDRHGIEDNKVSEKFKIA